MKEIFRNLDSMKRERERKIQGKYLSNLRFADDVVLITENFTDLKKRYM